MKKTVETKKRTTKAQTSDVYSRHMGAAISAKKVAPVLDLIRGRSVEEAKAVLAFDKTKAAFLINKVIKSAEANAVHNSNLSQKSLFVSEAWVSGGRVRKSGNFVGRGRFNPILKRSSHIYIGVSERK